MIVVKDKVCDWCKSPKYWYNKELVCLHCYFHRETPNKEDRIKIAREINDKLIQQEPIKLLNWDEIND